MINERPKDNDPAICSQCGWEGKMWETNTKEVYEGREGQSYHCPICDALLFEWIWKLS